MSCHVGIKKGNDSACFSAIRRTTRKEHFKETWADSLWKKIEQKIFQEMNNTQPLNS